ncbi:MULTISPECIES: hypothetical protein [Streptomyces]|uniref:hypothetical protein n=1 Tax=Streptomyces TaxID=1883 RepID=UPI000AD01116|nr:hypothetical protein [Streptomyces katrae]
MRSSLLALRAAAVAVTLAACTAVTAPAALGYDGDRGGVSIEPNPAEPGGRVKIRVRACEGDWAVARSPVFDGEVRLRKGHEDPRTLFGEAEIRHHADPGWHEVRVKCEGRDDGLRGSLEIRHRDHRPDPHHSPVWPVHAGGGAMAAQVAETTRLASGSVAKKSHHGDGPGLPQTVVGAVLAAAATLVVAGRALTLRRRRNGG